MRVLEQLEPQGVFRFFEELCAIPHGSRNCQAVSDWCAAFARERGLECHQDQAGNVIIIQEATPGYEAAAPVILQGHLDMVCEKEPGCTKDMAGEGLDLLVEDGRIAAVGQLNPAGLRVKNLGGRMLAPGFLDLHTHGGDGVDVNAATVEDLGKIGRFFARHGTTGWLCSILTDTPEQTLWCIGQAKAAMEAPADGAQLLGIHLEGPFLCYAKRGAQAAENLHEPDASMFHRLNEASGGMVRLITVAPEEEGAIPFIREVSQTCTVSLGHTTAGYETAMAAYGAGASHATHLFNAMPSFLHREPGVIGAALDSGATVELICDGLHIHPAVIRATHKLFGDKLVIISDSLRCAGMPDGEYELGGQPIEMKGGKATLRGTDTLAGSSSNLLSELQNVVAFGLPLEDAVTALTLAPARAVRLDHQIGSLAVGKQADLVLLNPDLTLDSVYVDGEKVR